MNIIRWLFGRRIWMPPDETIDHWQDLVKLGYTMQEFSTSDGRSCAFFLDGEQVTDWSAPITVDEMYRLRREWSNAEWERLQESE